MKKRAEDEKVLGVAHTLKLVLSILTTASDGGLQAQLKHMNEHALKGDTALLEDTALAVVPASFVREWRHWHIRPLGVPRPAGIDNAPFFCDHDLLALDPNKGDLDETMCIVRKSDWDTLQRL
jgi:hypothetical protein